MLCDELKPLKNLEVAFNTTTGQEQVIAEDSEGNCYGFDSWEEVYLKDEVDAAIAELKEQLESEKASRYAESVDAGMRERRLKRSLWLARAERAKDKQLLFHFSTGYPKLRVDGFYDPYSGRKELSPKKWIKVFNKVENKCRAKAEEFK